MPYSESTQPVGPTFAEGFGCDGCLVRGEYDEARGIISSTLDAYYTRTIALLGRGPVKQSRLDMLRRMRTWEEVAESSGRCEAETPGECGISADDLLIVLDLAQRAQKYMPKKVQLSEEKLDIASA